MRATHYVEGSLVFSMAGVAPHSAEAEEAFQGFLERVLDELEKIGRDDVDVTASLAGLRATFHGATMDDSDGALFTFVSDLRTALHAAECGTQAWPSVTNIENVRAVPAGATNGEPVPA